MSLIVATFYKFVSLPDYPQKQEQILAYCQEQNLKGTILLASEGINGTIAGTPQAIDNTLTFLQSDSRLADLEVKHSPATKMPFRRMKVRLKKEIVTLGKPDINPIKKVGTYVSPKEWNQLISEGSVTVIDTRNDYEVEIGTFKGAKNPNTQSFREFPEYVAQQLDPKQHKKVALFCTGGIRCEKATSYLLDQGFEEVYHLQGGILKYLEEVPTQESLWEGECFVFDQRVALGHNLTPGHYDLCYGCGHPISEADKATPEYEPGESCPHCYHQHPNSTQSIRL
jgi:UPF0176 protein